MVTRVALILAAPLLASAEPLAFAVLHGNDPGARVVVTDASQTGEVVGAVIGPDGHAIAARWKDGVRTSVGVLPATETSIAYAVNDAGTIVGTSGRQVSHAFVSRRGRMRKLEAFDGPHAVARDVNNTEAIVGQVTSRSGAGLVFEHAVLWKDGSMELLEARVPDVASLLLDATAINEAGVIVGMGSFDGQRAGFLLDGDSVIRVPALPPALESCPSDVNARGQVVGIAGDRVFLWAPGESIRDLGPAGDTSGVRASRPRINDAGIVSGPDFLWCEGRRVAFDALVRSRPDLGGGWETASPLSVDNAGIPIGFGLVDGRSVLFRLDRFACVDATALLPPRPAF